METYRIINRELSLNNQELRNTVNKLKHEITYLNRRLLEQREEFHRLKESIASAVEKKYIETMAVIYPDRINQKRSPSKVNMNSYRRSYDNLKSVDKMKRRSRSPPATSGVNSVCVANASSNMSLANTIRESSVEINKSLNPAKCPENISEQSLLQNETIMNLENSNCINEEVNCTIVSDSGQTLVTSSATLHTINEEHSGGFDPQSQTLSDATIYSLLDAPCSTPYNSNKASNQSTFIKKKVRVLVKKLSEEKIAELTENSRKNCSALTVLNNSSMDSDTLQNGYNSSSTISESLTANQMIRVRQIWGRAKQTQLNDSDSDCTHNPITNASFKFKNNSLDVSKESFGTQIIHKKKVERQQKAKDIKGVKSSRGKRNKENHDSDPDFICSEDDSSINGRSTRMRNKLISFKEPNLRAKLRNTTNLKL